MTIKLDMKDKKLLYELDANSKQSSTQLAKKIGMSKQGCTFKINNLIKKGVITSFPTVINTALIDYLSFRMYFKLIDATPKDEEEFRKYFINNKNIPWIVECDGMWDYIIVIFPSDFQEFENIITQINNKFGKHIEKKDIALVTQANHFKAGYLLNKKKETSPLIYAGQPKKPIKLEPIEKEILSILSKNARIPITEISTKLKTTPKNISYRIEKLKKINVIEGYTTTIDYEKIGFERYKVFIKSKNMNEENEDKFINYSSAHPNILYYSKSIGANDIELELIVKSGEHLRKIIQEIRNKFQNIIKSYETLKIHKEYKLDFYPWKNKK